MKVGIFSGTFDPLTNGHLWVVNEAKKMCDELHVLVGGKPNSEPAFHWTTRAELLRASLPEGIFTGTLYNQTIWEYIEKFPNDTVMIFRGIRDEKDFVYEQKVCNFTRARLSTRGWGIDAHFVFVMPPKSITGLSSTFVKSVWVRSGVNAVADMVPPAVLDHMSRWVGDDRKPCDEHGVTETTTTAGFRVNCIAMAPEVTSIMDSTTAGFSPPDGDPARGLTITSCSNHVLEMTDDAPARPVVQKMRRHYEMMVENGFLSLEETVSGEAVARMLDTCPYDLVVSEKFHLRRIRVDSVRPTGDRYLPCSLSVGPIIVEANRVLPNVGRFKDLGPAIVIEGKHRWLEAVDRGDEFIDAWVGEEAMKDVVSQCV